MILFISDNFFHYEAGNLCRLFFPYEDLKVTLEECEGITARAVIAGPVFTTTIGAVTVTQRAEGALSREEKEYQITRTMFLAFCEATGYAPKWGMLTGIHPVKFFISHEKELGTEAAADLFREKYFVSPEKLAFCRKISEVQRPFVECLHADDFSLYISIPFCPSRCNYCSFVSQSVEKSKKLIAPYLELLLEELRDTAGIVRETGLRLVSVYIGGGTPTTLSAEQLRRLIQTVWESFDLTDCKEFTVEAGRPDTIDEEKLRVLGESGITRISINPQTLENHVLELIGRKHTAEDVIDCFDLARKTGHNNINMDLIAGLEGDTTETFLSTLDKVLALKPENITVHSLALKRSAEIFHSENRALYHSEKERVEQMVNDSVRRLTEEGYEPYYLYRQSRMAGNLENTGWAKGSAYSESTACAYNIYTMDESQTVIACGAGGVSKLKDPYSNRLERIFNFKYAYEYIGRFSEIKERKKEVIKLYEQFRQRLHQIHQPSGTDQ